MIQRKLAFLLMTLLAVFLFLPPAPSAAQLKQPPPAEKLEYINASKPLPSCAFVVSGQTQGSGFLIDRSAKLLISNHHVVGRNENVIVVFPVYEKAQALVTRSYYLSKAPRIRGKVLATDPVRDLAVVQLDTVPNEVPEIPLAKEMPRAGDKTHMVGNPGDSPRAWVFAVGTVKDLRFQGMEYGGGQRVLARIMEIEADPAFSQGASGGPAVNSAGELVGVMAAMIPKEPGKKIYIDLSEVRVFLASVERGQATAAIGQGDYDSAIQWCNRAIAVHPGDAFAFNERGVAYAAQKQYDNALSDYSAALKLDASFTKAYRNRAAAYLGKGDADRAVADCTAALKLDPHYARAYLTRSKALARLGKNAESQADYQQAVKLDPTLK